MFKFEWLTDRSPGKITSFLHRHIFPYDHASKNGSEHPYVPAGIELKRLRLHESRVQELGSTILMHFRINTYVISPGPLGEIRLSPQNFAGRIAVCSV